MNNATSAVEYVGFWLRVVAAVIDSVLLTMLLVPLFGLVYGSALASGSQPQGLGPLVLQTVPPAIAVILFWRYKSATPGKMVIGAKIVDAATGGPPTTGQLVGRYFGYYVSTIPLMLGLLWVGWDSRKQGFHDKLAGTLVVKARREARRRAGRRVGAPAR